MEDEGAEKIAAEWGVSVESLREATWELQEREGSDGEVYGYFVRFDEDNDPAILAELGLEPGTFLREVSINAFDEPDYDRDDFESQQPPQPERGNGYVEDGYVEDGYVGSDEPSSPGPFAAFDGGSFAGNAFAPLVTADNGNITADSGDITADNGLEPKVVTFGGEPVTYLSEPVTYTPRRQPRRRRKASSRIERDLRDDVTRNLRLLDEAVAELRNLVRRTHNNPPALLDDLPPVGALIEEITSAQQATRVELAAPRPNLANVQQQVSIFQRLGKVLRVVMAGLGVGVAGNVATDALKGDFEIPMALYSALEGVAQSAQAWLSYLGG